MSNTIPADLRDKMVEAVTRETCREFFDGDAHCDCPPGECAMADLDVFSARVITALAPIIAAALAAEREAGVAAVDDFAAFIRALGAIGAADDLNAIAAAIRARGPAPPQDDATARPPP